MESRIVGEDQILMQVGEALTYARECDTTDKVLEVLFRMAVTAGKKVKTEIHFSRGNSSAVQEALTQLANKGTVFEGKKCMVIGNGEMGKLTALALKDAGADVVVTVRQYRSGEVQIPDGCSRINYGDRYQFIPECSFVVSATSSPNLTLMREEIEKLDLSSKKIFLDLAVPRDIDPEIANLANAEVYDIDSFQIDRQSEELKAQLKAASELVQTSIDEFKSWYECRNFVPMIQNISRAAAKDVSWRMGKTFHDMELSDPERQNLESSMEQVAAKVFNKLLFELRDNVSTDMLRECLEAFANAYPEVYS
jgi:glutamyl-tRNA reductase